MFGFVLLVATAFLASMYVASRWTSREAKVVDWAQWVDFKDKSLVAKYSNQRVPISDFVSDYVASRLTLKVDVRALFTQHRNDLFRFCFTMEHMKFVMKTLLPQGMSHGQKMDVTEVQWVYDRGNDFYRAFLGPMMIYTSAIFKSYQETLEEGQRNKLDLVCSKIQLKRNDKMLDIGCGWGTLGIHASKYFGADVTGVSISKEQLEWARQRAKDAGASTVEYLLLDYRDIPKTKYNKITCLEMAEHVGVKNFPAFMNQVYNMLEDDGLFYLQIAGLRRKWQFEDLIWGVFMGTWIFPAADASLPLAWTVSHLESVGFEVQSHENIGIHYSETISRWLDNCLKNEAKIVSKYGEKWFRTWCVFLAWSVVVAAQGSSTCHMIVAHKNRNAFDRKQFVGTAVPAPNTRAALVNPNAVLFPKDKYGSF